MTASACLGVHLSQIQGGLVPQHTHMLSMMSLPHLPVKAQTAERVSKPTWQRVLTASRFPKETFNHDVYII